MTIDCTRPIAATPVARQALQRLRAEHGEIMLHVTGGCCDARTPLCLKVGDLCLGPRDVMLGTVEDVPVYEMQTTSKPCWCSEAYVLDVVAGVPVGFSIGPADGMRFAIRTSAQTPRTSATPAPADAAQERFEEVFA